MEILPILPIDLARVAASPRPQSATIGTFGYGKQIANIANELTALALLAMVKRIAKTANGLSAVWSGTTIDHAPGTRHQAWIVMPIRSVNRYVC